jgi:hypothetical protein
MKQGPLRPRADLPPPRKAWNLSKFQVICGAVAFFLVAVWYWQYVGAPLKLVVQGVQHLPVASQNAFDQQIVIPKILGGASSMRPYAAAPKAADDTVDVASDYVGLASGWTSIGNGKDPSQLLVDVTSIRLWRKVERYGWFQFIPESHTIDQNRNKPILYELIWDAFKCSEGTAVKLNLTVYYEDGTQQRYFPWGYAGLAGIWQRVTPDTALSREMNFICAVRLTSESPTSANFDADRILGTWHVEDGAHGRITVGPIVISETQIAWTAEDGHKCVSDYQLASRSTGSAFPGASMVGSNPDHAYTTFVLELKGPHLQPCAKKMNSFTISLPSDQSNFAHFAAFFVGMQGNGTMHRVSSNKAFQ